VEQKRSWEKRYERSLIAPKAGLQEGDVVYLVGLEGHRVLRTLSTQPNNKFGQILFPIRLTKGSNR